MQSPISIRSHWTGKNPNSNFQRSGTKHKALLWPGKRMRFPPSPPWYLECCKQGEGWQRSRLIKPFGLTLLWDSEESHDWFATGAATSGT